jgi:DNA-binding transcriptional regulator YdaS (Cro superfamily)
MKNRVFTDERAEALLAAFRRAPGVAAAAARAAGCDPRTASKAWNVGLKTHAISSHYHRPFSEILAEEQEEIRARLIREEREAERLAVEAEVRRKGVVREEAVGDLTEERKQEAQLVRQARGSAILLLNSVTQTAAGLNKLAAKVKIALEEAAQGEVTMKEAQQIVSLMGKLTTCLRQSNDAGQRAMEMSRLLLGEPTKIIGHAHLEGISIDDARQRIAAAARALKMAEQAGFDKVDGVEVGVPGLNSAVH